jgi:adenylate cyclase
MPRWLGNLLATLAGVLLIAGVGWIFLDRSVGNRLVRLSYEAPFFLRNAPPQEFVIIYMTDPAARALQQRGGIWDRSLHAKLIRRLTQERPRAIFFDAIFADPSTKPASDPEFAEALTENGRVFLAAQLDLELSQHGPIERVIPPLPMFRNVAAGWGLDAFRPVDDDFGVRRLYAGTEQVPSCTWLMANWLGAELPDDYACRALPRWINYYGPVDCFTSVPYDRALALDGTPPGFFKDKIVLIGGRTSIGILNAGKDDFRHPFTGRKYRDRNGDFREQPFAAGMEIHATILANLLHREWLDRLSEEAELGFVLCFGVLLALVLPRFTPGYCALVATALALLVVISGVFAFAQFRLWYAWAIPAFLQTPIGLAWAVGARYFLLERRRSRARNAFAHYLSPHLAARLEREELSLEPGGTVVEVSIVFTDLENFTTLTEELNDPAALSELLTWYFTRATNHVLESDGTVLKYIGDAVFAVWGTPLRDSRHPIKAARAALNMHRASEREIQGRKLRTRVGVHTGKVLAGNLGSLQRFDYTCIGDPVNVAARIESLNKYLGTSVLISEATRARIGDTFVARKLGSFQVAGKKKAVKMYELLGEKPETTEPAWIHTFSRALAAYTDGDIATARPLFEQTIAERYGPDGPSQFYLAHIDSLPSPLPSPWNPTIELATK